jgi:hypothetical protein
MVAALYAALFVVFVFHPGLQPGEQQRTDYISFWTGGREMLAGEPGNIFNEPVFKAHQEAELGKPFDGILPWVISPSFMLYAAPLAKLPYIPSLFVFNALTWAGFALALWLLLPNRKVLFAMLSMPPVLFSLYHGQTGLMSAALIGMSLALLPTRPFAAGLLLGLLVYKPQIGLMFPFALIAGRYWKAVFGAALTATASLILSVVLFGGAVGEPGDLAPLHRLVAGYGGVLWDSYLFHSYQTFEHLIETQRSFARIQTVFGLVRVMGGSAGLAMALQGLAALVFLGVVIVVWRKSVAFELKAAVLLLALCCSTPYLQLYDLTVLCPVYALLFRLGYRQGFLPGDKDWMFAAAVLLFAGVVCSVGVLVVVVLGIPVYRHIRREAADAGPDNADAR